jgi:hypothetical protein
VVLPEEPDDDPLLLEVPLDEPLELGAVAAEVVVGATVVVCAGVELVLTGA